MLTANSKETSIHQKRTLAFVNHFILKTIEFMNNFATQCETKLMEFETKMQKVEASLIILETKLASIPGLNTCNQIIKPAEQIEVPALQDPAPQEKTPPPVVEEVIEPIPEAPQRDPELDKYYKMIQFGVPIQAVKLKMIQEGLDPETLT